MNQREGESLVFPSEGRGTGLSRIQSTRTVFIVLCWCVGLLAVFGLGLIGFLWSNKVYRVGEGSLPPQLNTETDPSNTALPKPSMALIPASGTDSLSIKQAMTNCDEEAARNPDGLYFLITPVIPANLESATLLIPPGEDYGPFLLIPSQVLISGLEDHSFQLSAREYEFSLLNTDTGQIQKSTAANGASTLTQRYAVGLLKFQIGFSFEDKSVMWTNPYVRQKGICYWVNALFQGRAYAPPSGRNNFASSKRFPVWARTLRCANSVCEPDSQLLP